MKFYKLFKSNIFFSVLLLSNIFLSSITYASFQSTPQNGVNDKILNEDNAVLYNVDRTYFATLSETDQSFVRWIQLENRLNTNKFMGSIVIKALGNIGVSSILVKIRGKNNNDRIVGSFRPHKLESDQKIMSYTTNEGLEFNVKVNPDSLANKSFIIKVNGKVSVD